MERNRIQKIQREELNYSLKDVLSITSDKYNDEEDLRYPYLENNEKPVNIFRKLFHNKLTLYISLIFVVLFTILFSFSLRECIPFAYNTNAFYRHEIITLRDEVFDRGNKIEDSYILSFDLEYSEISYKFNKDKNNLTDASINYTFKDGSLDYIFSFYSDKFDNRVNVEVINLDKNAAFFYKCIIDGIDEALYYDDFSLTNSSIEDSITVFDEVSLLINTIYQNVDNHLFNNFSIHLLDYLAYLEEATILELNDLVKAIEEKFDVTAAAPVAVAAAGADEASAEPANVTVTLTAPGGTKVAVIKAVREITGLGLVDAKGLVDKAPSVIKENIPAAEGAEIKEKLEAAGATVEVK